MAKKRANPYRESDRAGSSESARALFTPVDNLVDTKTKLPKRPSRLGFRLLRREKIGNVVVAIRLRRNSLRERISGASACAASVCQEHRDLHPHNTQFCCGYVHRKIAQTLKE